MIGRSGFGVVWLGMVGIGFMVSGCVVGVGLGDLGGRFGDCGSDHARAWEPGHRGMPDGRNRTRV